MHLSILSLVTAWMVVLAVAKPYPSPRKNYQHQHCSKSFSLELSSRPTSTALPSASNTAFPDVGSSSSIAAPIGTSGAETSVVSNASANATLISSLSARSSTSTSTSPTSLQPASHCGLWDSVQTGTYNIDNNLWGSSSATSGSQCFGVDSLSGTTLAWHTRYDILLRAFYL